ncbi:MAG: hypothetical protein LBQ93_08260 [Treponema sp.]|jgi:hypothetical protein|nr:hypothetical protein [Treponema sp.]
MSKLTKEILMGIIIFSSLFISIKLYSMKLFSFKILLCIMAIITLAILVITRDIISHKDSEYDKYPGWYKMDYIKLFAVFIITLLLILAL